MVIAFGVQISLCQDCKDTRCSYSYLYHVYKKKKGHDKLKEVTAIDLN